jgi:hypothetical protein
MVLGARLKPASVFGLFLEPASNPPQFLRVLGVAASRSRARLVVFPHVLLARLKPASVFACFWGHCLSLACSVGVFSFPVCLLACLGFCVFLGLLPLPRVPY